VFAGVPAARRRERETDVARQQDETSAQVLPRFGAGRLACGRRRSTLRKARADARVPRHQGAAVDRRHAVRQRFPIGCRRALGHDRRRN